jgi:anti-anti-sigma factor
MAEEKHQPEAEEGPFGGAGRKSPSRAGEGGAMVEEVANGLKPVRVFPHRAFCWSGLLGLGVGTVWCLTGTGPNRWLADWQRANWGQPFPGANVVLVLLLTLLLFLVVGYCLFTYVFGSIRYELSLPFTVRSIPDQEITLVSFADIEMPDAEHGKTIVRVPGEQFVALIEERNSDWRRWRKVLIDLGKIDYMSSKVLAKVIALSKRLSQSGGQLVLSIAQPDLHQVFVITKLDTILTLCRDKEEALKMFDPMPSTTDNQVIENG